MVQTSCGTTPGTRARRRPARGWRAAGIVGVGLAAALVAYRTYVTRQIEREEAWLRSDAAAPFVTPFQSGGSSPAVLLVHGFGSFPWDLAPVRPILDRAGLAYEAVLLDGHGASPRRLRAARHATWRRQLEAAYRRLAAAHGGRVTVVGFSLGGALSLDLAARLPVERLVVIAPYFRISRRWSLLGSAEGWSVRLATALPYVRRFQAGMIRDAEGLARYRSHTVLAPAAVAELARAGQAASAAAPQVRCPTLWVHAPGDTVADYRHSRSMFDALPASDKTFLEAGRSNHVVLFDHDAADALGAIERFVTARP